LCCEILFLTDLLLETVRDKLENIQYKMEQQQEKTNRLLDEIATLKNITMDGMYTGHLHEVLMKVLTRNPEVYTNYLMLPKSWYAGVCHSRISFRTSTMNCME